MPTYIILLGPPGAGKGTQAKRLADRLEVPHVSTGDLFRAMKGVDTPLARRVQEIMARGDLVDDQTTVEIVEERLSRQDCEQRGAILDGFPRNPYQADALKSLLERRGAQVSLVLLIDVPRQIAIERILGRARQEGRTDDTLEVAERRYEVYLAETEPLIRYYEAAGLLRAVDGDQTIDAVTAALLKVIEQVTGVY